MHGTEKKKKKSAINFNSHKTKGPWAILACIIATNLSSLERPKNQKHKEIAVRFENHKICWASKNSFGILNQCLINTRRIESSKCKEKKNRPFPIPSLSLMILAHKFIFWSRDFFFLLISVLDCYSFAPVLDIIWAAYRIYAKDRDRIDESLNTGSFRAIFLELIVINNNNNKKTNYCSTIKLRYNISPFLQWHRPRHLSHSRFSQRSLFFSSLLFFLFLSNLLLCNRQFVINTMIVIKMPIG